MAQRHGSYGEAAAVLRRECSHARLLAQSWYRLALSHHGYPTVNPRRESPDNFAGGSTKTGAKALIPIEDAAKKFHGPPMGRTVFRDGRRGPQSWQCYACSLLAAVGEREVHGLAPASRDGYAGPSKTRESLLHTRFPKGGTSVFADPR